MKESAWIEITRTIIRFDIRHIRKYLDILKSALQNEFDDLKDSVKQEIAQMTKEQRDEYDDYISEQYWELQEVIPGISYAGIIIIMWSLLEHTSIRLTKRIGNSRDVKIKPSDLKYKGIKNARIYFEKVLNIQIPNDSKWQRLMYINKIRDIIVHNDSNIPKDTQYDALRSYIERTNGIMISNAGKVQIDDTYCMDVIDLVEEYLLAVIDNCKKACFKRARNRVRPRN